MTFFWARNKKSIERHPRQPLKVKRGKTKLLLSRRWLPAIQFPELCISVAASPTPLTARCIFYIILSSERHVQGKRFIIFLAPERDGSATNGVSNSGGDKTAKLPQSTQNAKMARRRVTRCQGGGRATAGSVWRRPPSASHARSATAVLPRLVICDYVLTPEPWICEVLCVLLSWQGIPDCGAACSHQATSTCGRITCRRFRRRWVDGCWLISSKRSFVASEDLWSIIDRQFYLIAKWVFQ